MCAGDLPSDRHCLLTRTGRLLGDRRSLRQEKAVPSKLIKGDLVPETTDLVGSGFQTAKINFSLFKRLAGKISFYCKLITDPPTHKHHQRGIGARSILGIKAKREFSFSDWVRGNDIFELLLRHTCTAYGKSHVKVELVTLS